MQTPEQIKEIIQGSKYLSLSKVEELDCLDVNHPLCSSKVALFGAHLLSYCPSKDNLERLWLSKQAVLDGTQPIRGGVPICWPWFGNEYPKHVRDFSLKYIVATPSHGAARNQFWNLIDYFEDDEAVELTFTPTHLGEYGFGSEFTVEFRIRLADQCDMNLITHNQSTNDIEFGCALHTYFNIGNISECQLDGVTAPYYDKANATATDAYIPVPNPYTFSAETDRIHKLDDRNSKEVIGVKSYNQSFLIENIGNTETVVWNPWAEKSKSLPDMEDQGYQTMICVESAIVKPIRLDAMQSHCVTQIIY